MGMTDKEYEQFKTSIERLCKVIVHRFETKNPELGVQYFHEDLIDLRTKIQDHEALKFLNYKIEWLRQHSSIDDFYRHRLLENPTYCVLTPDGKIISVEEYMKTQDYNNKLSDNINDFLTDKKQKQLIDLFKKK